MIKLFITDLDGCLTYPFETPDWELITRLRGYNKLSRTDPTVPALTICTGRPQPYVEAVAQWLDIEYPVIFESGGGLYKPRVNELHWSPFLTDKLINHLEDIRNYVTRKVLPDYPKSFLEYSKHTDVGVVSANSSEIQEMYSRIKQYVLDRYTEFEIHYTEVSCNVIAKACNKGAGVSYLSELISISTGQMAYIGDGTNDIPALKKVERPFAPQNAREETQKVAEVLDFPVTSAVVKAYEMLIADNRKQLVAPR
ncbi:MAG TPA: HAD-IIB family hydrolase [Balneolales bacterium]|nr:HAD-IIB family hydrolase [Balneolales bacterium]